jgi:hypothetical protein
MFSEVTNATRMRAQHAGFNIVYGLPNKQSCPGYLKKLNFAINKNVTLLHWKIPLSSLVIAQKIVPDNWK